MEILKMEVKRRKKRKIFKVSPDEMPQLINITVLYTVNYNYNQ